MSVVKSSTDVLNYIDDFYGHVLARPMCYATSPRSLEDIIDVLEGLRAFVLGRKTAVTSFAAFTQSLGYGTTGICHQSGEFEGQTENDIAGFHSVADVLRQFLQHENRLTPPMSGPSG